MGFWSSVNDIGDLAICKVGKLTGAIDVKSLVELDVLNGDDGPQMCDYYMPREPLVAVARYRNDLFIVLRQRYGQSGVDEWEGMLGRYRIDSDTFGVVDGLALRGRRGHVKSVKVCGDYLLVGTTYDGEIHRVGPLSDRETTRERLVDLSAPGDYNLETIQHMELDRGGNVIVFGHEAPWRQDLFADVTNTPDPRITLTDIGDDHSGTWVKGNEWAAIVPGSYVYGESQASREQWIKMFNASGALIEERTIDAIISASARTLSVSEEWDDDSVYPASGPASDFHYHIQGRGMSRWRSPYDAMDSYYPELPFAANAIGSNFFYSPWHFYPSPKTTLAGKTIVIQHQLGFNSMKEWQVVSELEAFASFTPTGLSDVGPAGKVTITGTLPQSDGNYTTGPFRILGSPRIVKMTPAGVVLGTRQLSWTGEWGQRSFRDHLGRIWMTYIPTSTDRTSRETLVAYDPDTLALVKTISLPGSTANQIKWMGERRGRLWAFVCDGLYKMQDRVEEEPADSTNAPDHWMVEWDLDGNLISTYEVPARHFMDFA